MCSFCNFCLVLETVEMYPYHSPQRRHDFVRIHTICSTLPDRLAIKVFGRKDRVGCLALFVQCYAQHVMPCHACYLREAVEANMRSTISKIHIPRSCVVGSSNKCNNAPPASVGTLVCYCTALVHCAMIVLRVYELVKQCESSQSTTVCHKM